MNIEFRDWLKSEIQYLEDFEGCSIVEFRILKKLERTIKKYDELHKPIVIPDFVAEHMELARRSKTLMSLLTIVERRTELPEWKKEYDWISENSEAFARAWLDGYEVEDEPLYYAMVKGHELLADHDALSFTYWNFNMSNGYLLHGNQFSKQSRFLTKMTKEEWFELGINDSNADFVKVEEIEE